MRCKKRNLWTRAVCAMCGVWSVLLSGILGMRVAFAHPVGAPLFGPSGLGSMPTTDIVPRNQIEFGLGYEQVDPALGKVRFFPVGTATYGARGSELGIAYARERTTGPGFVLKNDYVGVHGKIRLLGDEGKAQLAAGAHYLNFGGTSGSFSSYYLTGSAPLLKRDGQERDGQARLRGHLGLIHQRIRGFAPDNATRPMVGLEWQAAPGLIVGADYLARTGQVASISSLIARYQWPNGLTAQVGAGQFRGSDNRLFAGVSYLFDTTKKRDTVFGKTQTQPSVALADNAIESLKERTP